MKRFHLVFFLVLAVTVGTFSPAAHAQELDARAGDAKTACLAGKVDQGIEILARLYTDTDDANYLYNQGRCFQQNNRPQEAIARFREYLRKAKDLNPDDRKDVEGLIKECDQMKAEQTPINGSATSQQPPIESGTAARMRTVGLATAAVGLVGVGVGVVMGLQVARTQSDIEKNYTTNYSQKDYNSGQRYELFEWVGYAVGGVALGTGAIFYYLGVRGRSSDQVAFIPVLSPGTTGALVRFRL